MSFDNFFKASSYVMIASGMIALVVSGGIGSGLAIAFALVLILAWKLEGTQWQLSERIGLIIVLLSLPLFYIDWKYQMSTGEVRERVGVSALAHLILFLSAVKLLQVKVDRDWAFLYLISFFEVILAAGLSISPLFLATLSLYMLCALCTILSFEILKARRRAEATETRLLVAPHSTLIRRLTKRRARRRYGEARRLPFVAFVLLLLIFALAMPLFFIAPRYGSSALARTGEGLTGFIGFSETVTLGDIGRLQKSNRVVMRVRIEDEPAERHHYLRWRGVALDRYTGRGWQRSSNAAQYVQPNGERNFFQLNTTEDLRRITKQTFFVEPIDTPVLFAASRVIALQGPLPYVRLDTEDSIQTRQHSQERISYKAYSDTTEPEPRVLSADSQAYSRASARYLKYPDELDPRIAQLAREIVVRANARNRYDQARAIEEYLQSEENYRYTLDLKAGGPDPLADFLFNVREGHCEYFSTAMAVMLRTLGVATRVVNGFQMGEYNGAAGVYTVTQKNAHSWVEVYFPETDSWVTFDPTPAAGRATQESAGLRARLGKYAEALELLWFQYVVGYDKQEQRSLAATMRSRLFAYHRAVSKKFDDLKLAISEWLQAVQGGKGAGGAFLMRAALLALSSAIALLSLALLGRRIWRLGFWRAFKFWRAEAEQQRRSAIEFYERMSNALASRGLQRAPDQTPLEFASAAGMPEVLQITRAYNRVRFGEHDLSSTEAVEIEEWLRRLEGEKQ